jgi:hypothetical protein
VTEVHEGRCACGNVQYRVSGEPMVTLACHCTFCQRMTGTAFSELCFFGKESVEMQGELSTFEHRSDESGHQIWLHFCPQCGVALSVTLARAPHLRLISRGTFDDPNWAPIKLHQFIRSAQSGVVFGPHLDCYEAGFRKLDGTPNEARRFPGATMSLGPGRPRQPL